MSRRAEHQQAMCAALGIPEKDWPAEACVSGNIYFLHSPKMKAVKIGFSFYTPKRLASLQTGSADTLVLLGTIKGSLVDEKRLHRRFTTLRIRGEWFKATARLLRYVAQVTA